MIEHDHPHVFFRLVGEEFGESFGYLSIIDGIPWLASSLEEAQSRIPATMFRLDPQHLVEQPNAKTGQWEFLYRAYLEMRPL